MIKEIKNSGIEILKNKYKELNHYIANKNYYEENNIFYIKEYDSIEIFTSFENLSDIENFVEDMEKTDIVEIFKHIRIFTDVELKEENIRNGKKLICYVLSSYDNNYKRNIDQIFFGYYKWKK